MEYKDFSSRIKQAIRAIHNFDKNDTTHDDCACLAVTTPAEALDAYLQYHGHGLSANAALALLEETYGKPYTFTARVTEHVSLSVCAASGLVYALDDEQAEDAARVAIFAGGNIFGYSNLVVAPHTIGAAAVSFVNKRDI